MKPAAFQEILVGKFTVCKDLSGHEARLARLSVKNVRKLRLLLIVKIIPNSILHFTVLLLLTRKIPAPLIVLAVLGAGIIL
jgi:hypothetical protein